MTTQRDITRALFKHHNVAFDSNAFKAHWDLGYTVVAVKDEHSRISDLLGDVYNPVVNTNVAPEQLKREEHKEKRRIREKGVWGCGLALNGEPIYSSFIWGFVGDDYIGSDYDEELIAALSVRPVKVEQ